MGDGACCHYCRKYRCECPPRPEPPQGIAQEVEKMTNEEIRSDLLDPDILWGYRDALDDELLRRLNDMRARLDALIKFVAVRKGVGND